MRYVTVPMVSGVTLFNLIVGVIGTFQYFTNTFIVGVSSAGGSSAGVAANWNIVLPLSKSALATVALLTILGNWTDFLRPLIYLNNQSQWTLSLG